jgi:peptidoglycan-associated lipoprotein
MTRRVDPSRILVIGTLTMALAGCASHPKTGAEVPSSDATSTQARATGAGGGADAETTPANANAGASAPGAVMFPALPSPKDFEEVGALRDVHFDFDRAAPRREDARVLDANARWLTAHPGALVLIEGHADERGTNEYNLALGENRARVTRDQLIARGVAASRISLVSYGEERPTCRERTEVCWAQNRRAHFLVNRPSVEAEHRDDRVATADGGVRTPSSPLVQR